MLNKLILILKKIVVGFLILYGYNLLVPTAAIISINLITVFITTLFGIPGLIVLIIIRVLIY